MEPTSASCSMGDHSSLATQQLCEGLARLTQLEREFADMKKLLSELLLGRQTCDIPHSTPLRSNSQTQSQPHFTPDYDFEVEGSSHFVTATIDELTIPHSFMNAAGGAIFVPSSADGGILATRRGDETLTHKTITGVTNSVDANTLRNGSTYAIELSGAAPARNNVLAYDGTNAVWQAPATTSSVTMGGDVIGNSATSVVRRINGIPVVNASDSIGIGSGVLAANTSGSRNMAFGTSALAANTAGVENNAFGVSALGANTTGGQNSAFGYGAQFQATTGIGNTSIGDFSLHINNTGSYNVGIGLNGGRNEVGSNNVHVGYNTSNVGASSVNSNGCTSVGANSGPSVSGLSNSTAIGSGAVVNTSNTIQLGDSSVTAVNTSGIVTASGLKVSTMVTLVCNTYTLPTSTTSNNAMQVLAFDNFNGGGVLTMDVVLGYFAQTQSVQYVVPVNYSTTTTWMRLVPTSICVWNGSTYTNSGVNRSTPVSQVEFDIRTSGSLCAIRAVRTLNTAGAPATATISFKLSGGNLTSFTTTAGALFTDTVVPAYYYTGAAVANLNVREGITAGAVTCQKTLYMNNQFANKIISLWDNGSPIDQTRTNYYGFGINDGVLRYQVLNSSSNHIFYADSTEVCRILGQGGISTSGPVSAGGSITLAGNTYALPTSTSSNNARQVLTFAHNGLGGILTMDVSLGYAGQSQSMQYIVPVNYSTTSTWKRLAPAYSCVWNGSTYTNSGVNGSTLASQTEFDIICTNAGCNVRMVRTLNTAPATATISYKLSGITLSTYSTAAGVLFTDSTVPGYYNTGGVPRNLNYYEVYTFETCMTFFPGTGGKIINIKIVRVGNQVTMTETDELCTHTGDPNASYHFSSTGSNPIPARFLPQVKLYLPISVVDNSTIQTGRMTVETDGVINIYSSTSDGKFSKTNQYGFLGFSVSWNV